MIFFAAKRHQPAVHRFERDANFPLWTLAYLHSGNLEFFTKEGSRCCPAPAFVLIPPHFTYVSSMWKDPQSPVLEYFAFFSPPTHLLSLLQWPSPVFQPKSSDVDKVQFISERLLEVTQFFQHPRRTYYRYWAWNILEEVLLHLSDLQASSLNTLSDNRITLALEYIHTDFSTPMSVEKLATRCGLSPSRFAHLFRKTVGLPPMQYLEATRLHAAAERLLSSSLTAAEVAEEVGFENASHFTKRFTRNFGLSPRRFRNMPEQSLSLLLKDI